MNSKDGELSLIPDDLPGLDEMSLEEKVDEIVTNMRMIAHVLTAFQEDMKTSPLGKMLGMNK